jgi:serine/threonine-protein kinase HipA
MRRCPITYQLLAPSASGTYSAAGLRRLASGLRSLADLLLDAEAQRREAGARAPKMSIQGVQPKLSARLRVSAGRFEIVDTGGEFILKPQSTLWPHLPENENLTMHLAASVGIEVPVHGLVRSADGSWTCFVRRFDRLPRRRKLAVEDFAQLSGRSRATKYDASMEQVAAISDRFATFPAVERRELFRRTLFFFLTGGEDMHLKNFSLLTRDGRVQLSPAYDLTNSTIVRRQPAEELALPLRGKKRGLTRRDLVDYFGREQLQLTSGTIAAVLERLHGAQAAWEELVAGSFLPGVLQEAYLAVLRERRARLWP